jgi:hypothetical protein
VTLQCPGGCLLPYIYRRLSQKCGRTQAARMTVCDSVRLPGCLLWLLSQVVCVACRLPTCLHRSHGLPATTCHVSAAHNPHAQARALTLGVQRGRPATASAARKSASEAGSPYVSSSSHAVGSSVCVWGAPTPTAAPRSGVSPRSGRCAARPRATHASSWHTAMQRCGSSMVS